MNRTQGSLQDPLNGRGAEFPLIKNIGKNDRPKNSKSAEALPMKIARMSNIVEKHVKKLVKRTMMEYILVNLHEKAEKMNSYQFGCHTDPISSRTGP